MLRGRPQRNFDVQAFTINGELQGLGIAKITVKLQGNWNELLNIGRNYMGLTGNFHWVRALWLLCRLQRQI